MRVIFFLIGFFLFTGFSNAQTALLPNIFTKDSSAHVNTQSSLKKATFSSKTRIIKLDREILFYWIMVLLTLLAIIKAIFSKYMENLFKVILNSTLRQSQLMEQLIQARRPSFYLNLLFILSFSTFLTLIAGSIMKKPADLNLFFACILLVIIIYSFKSMIVRILGWVTEIGRAHV